MIGSLEERDEWWVRGNLEERDEWKVRGKR
jgi:hypothetical protein